MSALLLPFLLGAAVAPATGATTNDDVIIARFHACGFHKIEVSYADDMQSDVVTVADEAASDDALACADRAVEGTGYLVFFEDLELSARSYKVIEELRRPQLVAASREWLAARGLLDKVPNCTNERLSKAECARRLETLCGPRAKGALRLFYDSVTINPGWRIDPSDPADTETLGCLLNASSIAGFEFGFIGNEAVD